ncbi:MAG: right-handed parallel beta-helix repeat-containing protein [Planctomycetota bacterium]
MRHYLKSSLAVLVFLAFAVACGERPSEPQAPGTPAFAQGASGGAKGGNAACPIPADVVVSDEARLRAALSAASSGDVIGLDGMIELTLGSLDIFTDGIVVTCATPGSGVVTAPDFSFVWAFLIGARNVTISHLVVDGSTSDRPFRAHNNGASFVASDLNISDNTVTCGGGCVMSTGVANANITDNYFVSAGGRTGVHLEGQGPRGPDGTQPRLIDGARVLRNTIVTTARYGWPCGFHISGLRVRDGSDVVVAHNVVQGPWANSLSPADLSHSRFEANSLDGADCFGIGVSLNRKTVLSTSNNVFRSNRVTGAGAAGIVVRDGSCGNVFVGNDLQGNADDIGAIFDAPTGANTLVGNKNVVMDNGSYDCDGDEVPDPNIITGRGTVLNDVNLDEIISDAVWPDCEELPDGSKACEW